MAVSNIRKTSSSVLLAIVVLGLIAIALFFLGGQVDPTAAKPEPKFTDVLLYFTYGVFIVSLLVMLAFAVVSFVGKFKSNPKSALGGLGAIAGLVVLLVVTYLIGSSTHLPLGDSTQQYNTDFYLKFSDMWLYSIYVLFVLTVCALIWGGVRGALTKKNK